MLDFLRFLYLVVSDDMSKMQTGGPGRRILFDVRRETGNHAREETAREWAGVCPEAREHVASGARDIQERYTDNADEGRI